MDVVLDDAHVVGRPGPAEVDRPAGHRAQEERSRRRLRIRRDRRRGLVGCRPDVPGRVLGGHLVVVGARRDRVRVARPGRLRDPVRRRRREAGGRRPVDVVLDDADVVGRRPPAERRPADVTVRGQRPGRRRRDRVANRRASLVRRRTDVAGRVLRGHLVEVGARRDVVRVARPGRLGDPVRGRRREARGGRAVDVVPDDAHVVGRCAPIQLRRVERPGRGERARR